LISSTEKLLILSGITTAGRLVSLVIGKPKPTKKLPATEGNNRKGKPLTVTVITVTVITVKRRRKAPSNGPAKTAGNPSPTSIGISSIAPINAG